MNRIRKIGEFWLFHTIQGALGLLLVLLALIVAVFGRFAASEESSVTHLGAILQAPSTAHPFGTDDVGRDLLSRVIDGAGYTIPAAIAVVAASVIIGSVVGVVAGYYGGWVNETLMRITDIFLSYPSMLLAIAVAASLGSGLKQTAIALIVVVWAAYARLAQVQTSAVRHRLFMDASEMASSSVTTRLFRHVLPNALPPVFVKATMDVAMCVEWIAALGFVGLGARPPAPEWGTMIAEAREYVLNAWWYVTFPSLALLFVVLGFNYLGGALDTHFFGTTRTLSRKSLRQLALVSDEAVAVSETIVEPVTADEELIP